MMCNGEKGNWGTVSFQKGKKGGLPADNESQPAKPHWEEIMRFLPHSRGMLLSYTLTLCLGKNSFVVLTSGKKHFFSIYFLPHLKWIQGNVQCCSLNPFPADTRLNMERSLSV